MHGQEKSKRAVATPANKTAHGKSSTCTSKSTGCKKTQSRVKPVPDFSKLHNKWSKKLEKQKACAKRPCTVVHEFDFTKPGTRFSVLKGEDVTHKDPTHRQQNSQDEDFETDGHALDSIITNKGIESKGMTGRATIAVNSSDLLRSRSRSKLPSGDSMPPPPRRSKHISKSAAPATYSSKTKTIVDLKEAQLEDHFLALAKQQASDGLEFEVDNTALSSILDNTGVSQTQVLKPEIPANEDVHIKINHKEEYEKYPRNSIYRQPEHQNHRDIIANYARLLTNRMTLDPKGLADQAPLESPFPQQTCTTQRQSLYSCPRQSIVTASCPRPSIYSKQWTMGPPASGGSCRKPRRVMRETSPDMGKSPALRVIEPPQTAPAYIRKKNFLGSGSHSSRHTPRAKSITSEARTSGVKDQLARELDFEDPSCRGVPHEDTKSIDQTNLKLNQVAGPSKARFASLDTTADLRSLEAIEQLLEQEIEDMQREDERPHTPKQHLQIPMSSKKRTPFSVLHPEDLLERGLVQETSEDSFIAPQRLHISSEGSTPSPGHPNLSNIFLQSENSNPSKLLSVEKVSPGRKHSPKHLPLQSLSPNIADAKSPRTRYKYGIKNSPCKTADKMELFKPASPYQAQVWSVMDALEKENLTPLVQRLSKGGKENLSPLTFGDNKVGIEDMINEVKRKDIVRSKQSPLIFEDPDSKRDIKPTENNDVENGTLSENNCTESVQITTDEAKLQSIICSEKTDKISVKAFIAPPAVWEIADEANEKETICCKKSPKASVETVAIWEPSIESDHGGTQITKDCRPGRRSAFTAPGNVSFLPVVSTTNTKSKEGISNKPQQSEEKSNVESSPCSLSDTTFSPPLYTGNTPEFVPDTGDSVHDITGASHLSGLGQMCRTFGSPLVVPPQYVITPVANRGSMSLAANVSITTPARDLVTEPKTQLLVITAQRYRDALLDEEVSLYTCRLPLKVRNKMNAERPNDPVATLLQLGDDRHFVPIPVIEDHSWMRTSTVERIPGSAFSRYHSTTQLATLV